MASVILRSAGAAIGNALVPGIGGAVLGTLGQSLGGLVDSKLGLGAHVEGPRLENLSVQDSRYGAGIPLVYGRARIAGNVIWSSDLIEAQHDTTYSGGKGGGSVSSTSYSYSVHCAVGLALGEIGGISTIWADSKIIYQDGIWVAGSVDGASIYTGTLTQNPDPFMESILGSGEVPGYHGLAYIVLENFQLANFGNRLPNLTFEIYPLSAGTTAPQLLETLDANINQFQPAAQNGAMAPLPIESSGSEVRRVILGGYVALGGTSYVFEVIEYDVTDIIPVEISRVQSTSFSASSLADCAWALAPDERFVALYLQSSSTPNHFFVIYDTEIRQFGSILSLTLTFSAAIKQVAWLDAQRFVIADVSGTSRGVRVLTRAGLDIVNLGFYNIWGSGTLTSRFTLYAAQFTPFAGGLISYVYTPSVGVSLVGTIYAAPIVWRNNTLVAGTSYTVASGLTAGLGSGAHAHLIQTDGSEWTLCFGTVLKYCLMSFEPGQNSAAITRSWQSITPSYGLGTTYCPLAYGTRIVLLERGSSENFFRVSEITLETGSFTLTIDAAIVSGTGAADVFSTTRLDSQRFLMAAVGGFSFDVLLFGMIERSNSSRDIASLVSDILEQAGYAPADYDVSTLEGNIDGYVVQPPLTARAAIEPLQVYTPFDLVETAGVLEAVPRSATASVTVPSSEWRAVQEGRVAPAPLIITRAQELDLPREVVVDYIDAGRDFEVNSQQARRVTGSALSVQKINLPVVAPASTVKRIAETRLYTLWAERELVRVALSRRYLALDAGDVINLDNGDLLRVTRIKQAGGHLTVEGFYVTAAAADSTAIADSGLAISAAANTVRDSYLTLLDVPLLQTEDDQPGFYAAVTGLPGWTKASLWRSADAVNYSNIATLGTLATVGMATTVLADGITAYQDNAHSVTVQILNGSLSSCTLTDLLNGRNAACLGGEIIQFQTATLVASGLYQLSSLLRGRRGTENATTTHAVGESFVMLSPETMTFIPATLSDRGRTYQFRALTNGQSLGDAQDTVLTLNMYTLRPFAPANVVATRASGTGSDAVIVWKRRARIHGEWADYIEVPLDEDSELYDVEVMNGGTVVRTFASLTSPTVTYTAAQQSSDWGVVPATFSIKVYQLSARFGRGEAASVTI